LDQIKNSMQTDFAQIEKDLKEQENITRPFGEMDEISPSQFNQAPTQPQPPQAADTTDTDQTAPSAASKNTTSSQTSNSSQHEASHDTNTGASTVTPNDQGDPHLSESQKQGQS